MLEHLPPDQESELSFARDGAQYHRELVSKNLIAELLDEISAYEKNPQKVEPSVIWDETPAGKVIRYIPTTHIYLPKFYRLVSAKILALAASHLKEDGFFSTMDLHMRAAGRTPCTPPHQDSFLGCYEDGFENMVSCYIALQEMNASTANLKIIRGSHLNPTLPHKMSRMRGFSSVIEETSAHLPPAMLAREHGVRLAPGDALFFHSKVIHYTNQELAPNEARGSISIRIKGQSVRYSEAKRQIYLKNVAYNRSFTMQEGLTAKVPKPQHA